MIQGKTNLVAALRDYFGTDAEGKPIGVEDLKKLSLEDRNELRQMLRSEGYDIEDPNPPQS